MGVVRLLRVMRIFRILKLVRYLQDSNILLRSLLMARRKILIFFSTVGILVTIFGALIFVIEAPQRFYEYSEKHLLGDRNYYYGWLWRHGAANSLG